jgi:hypothetical protein
VDLESSNLVFPGGWSVTKAKEEEYIEEIQGRLFVFQEVGRLVESRTLGSL